MKDATKGVTVRHTMKLGVMVVAVVAAVMGGIAFAQTDDSVDPVETRQSQVTEHLAPLVEDGTITQDQADAIAENFSERFADRLAQREEHRAEREAYHQELLTLLDMEDEDLRAAISEGMTLAEIAEQQGTTAEAVIDLMVGHAEERLADAVADELLTQAEADEKLVEITADITDKVNNGGGLGKGFGPGHRHSPDGEGFGGQGFGRRGPGGPGAGGQGFGGFGAPQGPAADAINV